jgi:ABC-type transport system involved in cytochrome c biogenesis permease subunit
VVHVLTIVASYGAFMLAWGLGNYAMFRYAIGAQRPAESKSMALFAYRAMQVGVLLVAAGTLLGAWWAAESWGRFWGWDPKEVWAFITLVGYLIVLHARKAGLIQSFGLLAGSVLAFNLVVMAWYGVNFMLGAGLHAYAFGDGGQPYVISAMIADTAFVLYAYRRYDQSRRGAATEQGAGETAVDLPQPVDAGHASVEA